MRSAIPSARSLNPMACSRSPGIGGVRGIVQDGVHQAVHGLVIAPDQPGVRFLAAGLQLGNLASVFVLEGGERLLQLLHDLGDVAAVGAHAFDVAAERRQGQPDIQHPLLAEPRLQLHRPRHLDQLGPQVPRARLQQSRRLHGQGGTT